MSKPETCYVNLSLAKKMQELEPDRDEQTMRESFGMTRMVEHSAYEKTIAALKRLTKVGPPSVPTTGAEWAVQCLKDNCKLARETLKELGEE